MIPLLLGEGAHEVVNGHVHAARFPARLELQGAVGNGHGGVRGNDVNMVGLDGHAIGYFADAHDGLFGNEFGEHAFVFGIQMLDQDEGHACVLGKITHEFGEGFDSAGGSADGGNQEVVLVFWREGIAVARGGGWLGAP